MSENVQVTIPDGHHGHVNITVQGEGLQPPGQQGMANAIPMMMPATQVMPMYGSVPFDPHMELVAKIPGIRVQAIPCTGYCGSPREFKVNVGTLGVCEAELMRAVLGRDGCCDNDLQFRIFQSSLRGIHVTFKVSCCDAWYEVRYNGVQIGRGDSVSDGCCDYNLSVKDQAGHEVFLVPPPDYKCCPGDTITHKILDPKTKMCVATMFWKRDLGCCPADPFVCVEFQRVQLPHLRLLLMSVALALARNTAYYNY